MKFKLIFLSIALFSITAFAQTKMGTIDNDYVLSLMPETKIVLKMAQEYSVKLDSSFQIKVTEYQNKISEYKEPKKALSELEKKVIVDEIQNLEVDIQKYRQNGTQLMQLKKDELMRPLYQKLNKAIKQVAQENKYTHIQNIQGSDFSYIDTKYDITVLVLKNLGIEIPISDKK